MPLPSPKNYGGAILPCTFWDPGARWWPSLSALCSWVLTWLREGPSRAWAAAASHLEWLWCYLSLTVSFGRHFRPSVCDQKPVLGQPHSEQKGGLDGGRKEKALWIRVRKYEKRLCSHHQLSLAHLKKKGKKIICTSMQGTKKLPFLLPTLLSNSHFCSCVAGMERDCPLIPGSRIPFTGP